MDGLCCTLITYNVAQIVFQMIQNFTKCCFEFYSNLSVKTGNNPGTDYWSQLIMSPDDMPGGTLQLQPQQQSPAVLTRIVISCREFSREELHVATDGFSNILGEGGFGRVYKGRLPNGKFVAVKKLESGSQQGDREFQAEVEAISRVNHRYLVTLVGYCTSDDERMLVYEFVPNNTLKFHLHGKIS